MVATQEEERKRISRDLHDDIGTKLSALKLFLSSLHEKATNAQNEEMKQLAENAEQFTREAVQDVRRLLLRDRFDLPDLAAMDDGIANGTHEPEPGEPYPLSLFTAPRITCSNMPVQNMFRCR